MSLVAHYRLQFLIAWLALDAKARARLSPRQIPSVAGLLAEAQAMQQMLQPWLEALLIRRKALAWTLCPATMRIRLAGLVREDLRLEPFDLREFQPWQANQIFALLEAELVRLVRLTEAPCVFMTRPGWGDRWEVARWGLATCLVRISQLEGALDGRLATLPAHAGLHIALDAAWQRLTAGSRAGAA